MWSPSKGLQANISTVVRASLEAGMELEGTGKRIGFCELFVLFSLVITVTSVNGEFSFQGSGFQVYYITSGKSHGESNEIKLWFRTKQLTGILMMIQNGGGSLTLVGIYDGKLR